MSEFIDEKRKAASEYEAIMASQHDDMEAFKESLNKLISVDSNYLDSYNTLYSIALSEEDFLGAEIMLNRAFDKALQLVGNSDGETWPKELSWQNKSNQHIIRTFLNKSIDFWMEDKWDEAKNILTFLNNTNPKEGLGFDFYLLAVSHKRVYSDFLDEYTENGIPNKEGLAWFERNSKASK